MFKTMNRGITKPNLAIFLLRRSPFRSESEFAFKGITYHQIWRRVSVSFISTSILCIVHQDYQATIASATCFDKPNLFGEFLHRENRTCKTLLVCKHPWSAFSTAHHRLLCIYWFSFILNANSAAFKAHIHPKTLARFIFIKPFEFCIGWAEIASKTNHLFQPIQFL